MIKWKHNKQQHVSQDIVREFEETLQACLPLQVKEYEITHVQKVLNKLLWVLAVNSTYAKDIVPKFSTLDQKRMVVLMGGEYEKCLSNFIGRTGNIAYFFDAWPHTHKAIERLILNLHIETAFFSSSQVANTFNEKVAGVQSVWLPEAINIENYHYADYESKYIDVLQFGRKHDAYHEKVVDGLQAKGYTYLYEKIKGELVFLNQQEFVDGLAGSKISICFPSSLTHPERSGHISTMTVRYLQSMASKCLIVGVMPEEMVELFDYNPIIQADFADPVGQLSMILENYRDYIPLIEKNYETVKRFHTWENRCDTIKEVLYLS